MVSRTSYGSISGRMGVAGGARDAGVGAAATGGAADDDDDEDDDEDEEDAGVGGTPP